MGASGSGRGIRKATVFDGTTLSGTVTSAVQSGIAGGTDMSFFVQLTGAGANIAFTILTSEDGTNFVAPETGSDIITVADELLHHCVIRIPVCPYYKIKAVNSGASCAGTAKILSL